jgi:formate hydrogenlyase subunit 3/multisubunit Na+/H+ antiporter MnhD subunit
LFFEYLVAECWFGPTLATLFNVVPKARRGTAQGLFSISTALGNVAPALIGFLVSGDNKSGFISGFSGFGLDVVLMSVVSGAYVVAGFLFLMVSLIEDSKK